MRRVTGLPSSAVMKICSQSALVSALWMPLSTIAQPTPSATSQRLMWSRAKGSGMRSQRTPGAISCAVPEGGGATCGKRSAASPPLSGGLMRCCSCVADALEDGGDPLADADAHGDERIPSAAPLKLAYCGEREPRARGAKRMADGDGAAIGIDAAVGEVDLEQLEAAEHLAREG